MIARFATWKLKKGMFAGFKKSITESMDFLRTHKGIRGMAMFHSKKEPDSVTSITFWDSEADSDNSRAQPEFNAFIRQMEPFMDGLPQLKMLDVEGLELHMENFK